MFTGGIVHIRLDALVKVEAEIMRGAGCTSVVIEQHLISTKGDHLKARTNEGDQSEINVTATGVFSPMERTFLIYGLPTPMLPPTGLFLQVSFMYSRWCGSIM